MTQSSAKMVYPALFSPGLVKIELNRLEDSFVTQPFDTPARRRLTSSLRLFIQELIRLGAQGDVWIDGSYATKDPHPQDIDVVLVISPLVLHAMTQANSEQLGYYGGVEGRAYVRTKWHIDFYIIAADNDKRRDSWQELFSNNPDQSNPKGIPFVEL